MSEFGMLTDKQDVLLFILYILKCAGKPVTEQTLNDMAMLDGIVNYFQFSEALPELLAARHIAVLDGESVPLYEITALGTDTLRELERTLPRHARDSAQRSVFNVTAKQRRDKQIQCNYVPDNGGYSVTCRIEDDGDVLLSVTLFVPTHEQAQGFMNRFKSDAERIYGGVITLFTDEG